MCTHDNFCPRPPLMGLFDWLITKKIVALWTHSNYKLWKCAYDNFCPRPPLMGLFDWLITEKFVTLCTHSNYYKLMYVAFPFGLAM
jgi:hypothetical protein